MNPILFIHGIGGTEEQYQPIIKFLRGKGINNFYEFNYKNRFGLTPIKTAAEELAEFIKNNVKAESINIVAISQGGIIALAYLKYFKNINIEKLFTICTPHKGSRLAKIADLPGLIDLRPDSKLLKELEIFGKTNKIKLYSIYTPFDLMVYPGWSARAGYGKHKIIFAPGHGASLSWPATMRFIYKNLLK
jgi:triacylglycerol esterase/lipase EstA (alpha/beta hydrolase family)